MNVTETLRAALVAALESATVYKVAKATGMKWDTLQRFASGAGDLRGKQLNALAEYLDLELTRRKKGK